MENELVFVPSGVVLEALKGETDPNIVKSTIELFGPDAGEFVAKEDIGTSEVGMINNLKPTG